MKKTLALVIMLTLATPSFSQVCTLDNANTVASTTSSTCSATSSTYNINASNMAAVHASGTGSVLNHNLSSLNVTSDAGAFASAKGIFAEMGSKIIVISPATVETTTDTTTALAYNNAVEASGAGSEISLERLSATTHSQISYAIYAVSEGKIQLNGDVIIHTTGSNGNGIFAYADNSIITQTTGRTVDIHIDAALGHDFIYGVLADSAYSTYGSPAQVTIGGGQIRETSPFILASPYAARSNSSIRAIRSGIININGDTNITTQGVGSRGLYVSGPKRDALTIVPQINQAAGTTITIATERSDSIQAGKSGASWGDGTGGGPGIVNAPGRISAINNAPALIVFLFPDQIDTALRIENGNGTTVSQFNAGYSTSSGILTAERGPSIRFGAGNGNLVNLNSYTLTGGYANISVPRGLIHLDSNAKDSKLQLRGASSTTVNTLASTDAYLIDTSDGTAELTLAVYDTSVVTGSTRSNGSLVNINLSGSASVWNLEGRTTATRYNETSTLSTLTLNAGGTLDASAGVTNATSYTLTGNVVANGGTIALDTELNDGTSTASNDVLTIDGNTSGTGRIRITNTGGSGAETVSGDGILVLSVTGNSNATFTLASPLNINGWEYSLVRGTSNTAAEKNWYLKSARSGNGGTGSIEAIPTNAFWMLLLTGLGIVLVVVVRRRRPY